MGKSKFRDCNFSIQILEKLIQITIGKTTKGKIWKYAKTNGSIEKIALFQGLPKLRMDGTWGHQRCARRTQCWRLSRYGRRRRRWRWRLSIRLLRRRRLGVRQLRWWRRSWIRIVGARIAAAARRRRRRRNGVGWGGGGGVWWGSRAWIGDNNGTSLGVRVAEIGGARLVAFLVSAMAENPESQDKTSDDQNRDYEDEDLGRFPYVTHHGFIFSEKRAGVQKWRVFHLTDLYIYLSGEYTSVSAFCLCVGMFFLSVFVFFFVSSHGESNIQF